jgi:hypothetical protein
MDLNVAPEEHRVYARWIDAWSRIALAALIGSFAAYLLGLFEPFLALERLPGLWQLPAAEFVAQTGAPAGWEWIRHLGHGDYLNFAGIVLLGTGTLVAYIRLLAFALLRGDRLLAALALAQVAVLALAISGFAAVH